MRMTTLHFAPFPSRFAIAPTSCRAPSVCRSACRGAARTRWPPSDGLLAGREAGEVLQAALGRLSPELRETVILRDLEELEYREISAVLRVPEGTVKSRLNRGRAELARLLRKQRVSV